MDITDAAKKRACELANAERVREHDFRWAVEEIDWEKARAYPGVEQPIIALARYIHETSGVAKDWSGIARKLGMVVLADEIDRSPLILPDDPDPLLDIIRDQFDENAHAGDVWLLRQELAKRGLKIVEATDD